MPESGYTTSLWMSGVGELSRPKLDASTEADVCVIGAGIAGLTTAYLLAREGRSVIVLDDGPIGGGETGRTTAHLVHALDDRYYRLERIHGEDGARLAAQSHTAAIDLIESIVAEEKIACDFARVDGYLFLDPSTDSDTLEKEEAAARRAGLRDVRRVANAPAPFQTGPALHFPFQAQFHPLRYLEGLARALEKHGGRICCDTHVSGAEDGDRVEVKAGDFTVRAGAAVAATNSPITDYVVTHVKQAPYRTFVVAFLLADPAGIEPILLWDTADPYHYIRTHPIEGGGLALIVGGEDHKTGQKDDAGARFERLEAWTRARYPRVAAVLHRWSGQVLEPVDFLALIGRNPGSRNVYIATGDSGNGMTHGTIAGMLLRDLILGRKNAWSDLYDPERVRLSAASAKEFLKENLNVAGQYAHWLAPGDVAAESAIAPGAGAVLRRDGKPIAAYRDEHGMLHERSAVCTHLKCIVRWNSLEKSWDCPCHGSRFDPHGKVLNGPAASDLEEVEAPVETGGDD